MNKGPLSQEILGYTYESAIKRMKAHPEYAEKQKKIAKDCPRFESEDEATAFAIKLEKEKPFGGLKIWATIEKDEEYYRIGAPWFVSNVTQHVAAEYIGLCYLGDANDLI